MIVENAVITAICLPLVCLFATLLFALMESYVSKEDAKVVVHYGLIVTGISLFVSWGVILINVVFYL